MIKTALLASSLMLAGCAGSSAEPVRTAKSENQMTRLLAGKTAGKTRSCIPLRSADRQTIIDERTILYRASSKLVYRNDLPVSCAGLDDRSTLIHRTTLPSICSGEIFEYQDAGTGFTRGSCSFGEFTEYRTPR